MKIHVPALRVLRDSDQASRQMPLEGIPSREKGRVRSSIAQRHTETLGAAHGDVGSVLDAKSLNDATKLSIASTPVSPRSSKPGNSARQSLKVPNSWRPAS